MKYDNNYHFTVFVLRSLRRGTAKIVYPPRIPPANRRTEKEIITLHYHMDMG